MLDLLLLLLPSSSRGSSSTKSNEKEVILELPGRTLDDARMRHKEEGEGGGREGESASSGRQVPRRAFVPSSLEVVCCVTCTMHIE